MRLNEKEIKNFLLAFSTPAAPTAFPQHTRGSTPRKNSCTHFKNLAQLLLDLESLILNQENLTSFTKPWPSLSSMDYEQPLGGTQAKFLTSKSSLQKWPIINGFGLPDSSNKDLLLNQMARWDSDTNLFPIFG